MMEKPESSTWADLETGEMMHKGRVLQDVEGVLYFEGVLQPPAAQRAAQTKKPLPTAEGRQGLNRW